MNRTNPLLTHPSVYSPHTLPFFHHTLSSSFLQVFLTKPNSQKFFIDGKAITTRNDLPLYAGVPASNIPLPNITGNDTPLLLSSDSYLPY